jgi:hypothetical protein
MKTPRIYYGALAVFCIAALGVGMASAGDGTHAICGNTGVEGYGHPVPGLTSTTVQQHLLTHLEEQGVDVSALKTAFQNGDTAAIKIWFENYRQSHPFTMTGPGNQDASSS